MVMSKTMSAKTCTDSGHAVPPEALDVAVVDRLHHERGALGDRLHEDHRDERLDPIKSPTKRRSFLPELKTNAAQDVF